MDGNAFEARPKDHPLDAEFEKGLACQLDKTTGPARHSRIADRPEIFARPNCLVLLARAIAGRSVPVGGGRMGVDRREGRKYIRDEILSIRVGGEALAGERGGARESRFFGLVESDEAIGAVNISRQVVTSKESF